MILTKNVSPDGYIKLQLTITPGTQNVASNYTPITWDLKLISSNSSANINSSVAKVCKVVIDNVEVYNSSVNVSINGGATKTLASGSRNITHDSSGSKLLTYSFSQAFNITYSGQTIGTISASGSGNLTTIPRATTPTVSGTNSLGSTITINTPRASTSFTHRLYYSWGSQIIDEEIASGVTTSTTFLIPKTLANYIPNGTAGTMYIKCVTYNGNTIIGTKTITITVTMPNTAEFQPKITGVTLTEANAEVPSTWGVYVKGISTLNGTVNRTTAYSSTIKTYKIEVNGAVYTTQTFTTAALNTSGTNTIKVTITDSRGRTATYSTTFNVIDYEKPYITSFILNRKSPTTATLKIVGGVYAVNNKNTYSYSYKYKKKTAETYTEVTITNNAYTIDKTIELTGLEDVTYDFIGLATDQFNTFEKTTTLPTTKKIFNVKPDGNGFAFFKKSEKDGMEIAKPIYDEYDTRINNGLSVYRTNEVDIDPNTTLEELILTETNTPGGFHYVRTMFYATKSATSNRTQIAYPYAYDTNVKKALYTRAYVSGIGWSEWAFVGSEVNAEDYAGLFQSGKQLLETGWVTITPTAANTPTAVNVAFKRAYSKIPVVIPATSSGVIGTQVLGASTNGITKTSVNIVLTRTNVNPTTVYYYVLGEV
jgi:hypothetical protein